MTALIIAVLSQWGQNSCFGRPSTAQSGPHCLDADLIFPSRLGDGQPLVSDVYPTVSTRIIALRAIRRPFAVPWFVVSIVVDAIKGVPFWARSHVSIERAVVVQPARAHCDTSTAVTIKSSIRRCIAPFLGMRPRHKLSRNFFPGREAVLCGSRAYQFSPQASTTVGVDPYGPGSNCDYFPAVTQAPPSGSSVWSDDALEYQQSTKPLTGFVYKFHEYIVSSLLFTVCLHCNNQEPPRT